MSGANQEDFRKAAVVWQNDTFRIVRKAWGDNAQYREFLIEMSSLDALGARRWTDYTVVPNRAMGALCVDVADRLWLSFRTVLESLYTERYEKKPEAPAETGKPEAANFVCGSVICQCGWVTNLQKDVWPASVVCANRNCSRFGKRYRPPVVRLEMVEIPEVQPQPEDPKEAMQVLLQAAKAAEGYGQDGG